MQAICLWLWYDVCTQATLRLSGAKMRWELSPPWWLACQRSLKLRSSRTKLVLLYITIIFHDAIFNVCILFFLEVVLCNCIAMGYGPRNLCG